MKRILFLLVFIFVCGRAQAGVEFGPFLRVSDGPVTEVNGNPLSPLGVAGDPSVIFDGVVFKLWFTTGDSRGRVGFAYAESVDGLVWSVWKKPVRPDSLIDLVFAPISGRWNGLGAETASVLRGPDGIFRMYYTGDRPNQTFAIGLATSADGINWTDRSTPVFVPKNSWEKPVCDPGCHEGGVLEPSVLWDPISHRYKMWYAGLGTAQNSFLAFRIGYATSVNGIDWTRNKQPVLDLGSLQAGSWDDITVSQVDVVADPAGGYDMFYFGESLKDYRDNVPMQRGSIGRAFSPDGVHWTKDPNNPVLSYREGRWDNWTVGGPSALFQGGKLLLWYFGNQNTGILSNIGLAGAGYR